MAQEALPGMEAIGARSRADAQPPYGFDHLPLGGGDAPSYWRGVLQWDPKHPRVVDVMRAWRGRLPEYEVGLRVAIAPPEDWNDWQRAAEGHPS